jgi:hypothetical protein
MKKTIVGIAFSTIFLIWVFWGIDWGQVWVSFSKVHWPYIFLYFLVLLIIQFIRSLRWELLLRPLQQVGQKVLFPITSVGFMAIAILPVRSGELVRPYLLSQKKQIPMSAALATIVVERILDVLTILLFIIFISSSAELPQWVLGAGYIAMAFIGAIFSLLYLMVSRGSVMLKITEAVLRPFSSRVLDWARNFIISFSQGARILFHWRVMTQAFIFSIILWTVMVLCNYMMFFAFSFSLSLVAAFVLVIVVDLGLMIPAAPGFVGSFEFLCVVALAIFGVGREEALSFSILSHALQLLFVAALGVIFLPMMKIPGFTLGKKVDPY